MFARLSRYHKLPEVVTTDSQGRTLASKALRLLPPVTGTFRHTVEGADRLDHLAYKYYQQPQKWWRLSDANPEFLSPQALLGKEPLVKERFPVTFNGAQPPWTSLVRNLTQRVGVEEVKVVEEVYITPSVQIVKGQSVLLHIEQFERAVLVTYNQLHMSAGDLAGIITAAGFAVQPPQRLGRVGRQIIIPRDVTE